MISDRLEKLILSGKANYRMFTHAATGKSQIAVTNDRFIVITDIWIYDWLDESLGGTDADIATASNRANKQITIYSDASTSRFIHRSQLNITLDPLNLTNSILPSGSSFYGVYLPHRSNVTIEILNVPAPQFWLPSTIGSTGTQAQARQLPFGYSKDGLIVGVSLPSVRAVNFTAIEQTRLDPITEAPAAGSVFSAEGFQVAANATNAVNEPAGSFQAQQYPIINIGYVEIFETPDNVQGAN